MPRDTIIKEHQNEGQKSRDKRKHGHPCLSISVTQVHKPGSAPPSRILVGAIDREASGARGITAQKGGGKAVGDVKCLGWDLAEPSVFNGCPDEDINDDRKVADKITPSLVGHKSRMLHGS
mmetsp:Transcript_823/g.2357  ORF Transcript_823/g.2357 Transcript_823/m.2357 type:complete len:121 (+) Transcript_823:958-1320(+)